MSKKDANSVSSNIKLITKQEMVLIKNSEEAKNTDIYGNLYGCLEAYTDLTKSKLNKDLVFDSKAKMTLTNNKKLLMENVKKEWYSKTLFMIATEDTFCQLCGQKNIYICYIVNRLNGIELNVGRDCVTSFETISGLKTIISNLNKAQRDHKKDARRIEFEVREGEEVGFLKQAESTLVNFPILLPYNLSCDLKNTLADCNRAKNIYINQDGNIDEVFIAYAALKVKFKELYNKALKHYEKVKTHPLVCDKRLTSWLIKNCPTVVKIIQKNDGILDENSLKFVFDPEFVHRKITIFADRLGSKDVKIVGVEGDVIRFFIKNNTYFRPVTFTVSIKDFMKQIGCKCLTNEYYKYGNRDLPNIKIDNTGTNFEAIYGSIDNILKTNGYSFTIDNKTSQAYWEKRQSKKAANRWRKSTMPDLPTYKKTSKEEFLCMVSQVLFDGDLIIQSPYTITSKINAGGKWITKADKDENARIAAFAAGQQKQREFTPY
jgi:hypothetical protein